MTEAPSVPLIPREVLFGNPSRVSPRLSPDGESLAFLAPKDGVLNVWVGPVGSPIDGDEFEPVTDDRVRGIRLFFWAEDNKHIVYLQDEAGDENWRVHAVDPATKEDRDLTPFEGVQAQILDKNRHFPDALLVALNRENPELHDAYRLTLSTGDLDLVAKNPGNVVGYVADRNFEVRAAVAATPEGGTDLLLREGDGWNRLIAWDKEDALSSGPVGFAEEEDKMYLLDSREANAARLVLLDLTSGETEVLVEDPRYDVSGVVVHPETHEAQAAAVQRARTEWIVLDDAVREDFEALKNLGRGDFSVTSRDRADENWLVAVDSDDGGASYFAYDRNTKRGEHLFDARPDLADYPLAKMEPISFTSRDGLEVEGYLTLPPGATPEGLPMVLNVHGGPWARDGWGYDPEAQWFANRGYACLQVNFRGSTGYGKDFLNAGNREWGGRMHDDLVDAVGWAVGRGVADPERVAIYGGSYGGYAALVGATFTPDLFRCAVDIVGPSNIITLIESVPPYWKPLIATFTERVGDPETEPDFLKSRSPLFFVDRIRIPLLIAQGANDPRVKQAESEQIVRAMKERGIDHEYLLFEDEGHGFARPENRLRFYAAAEEFLAKHLGGRAEE
ncbi:MAG: Dipeptidyl anminopeptidase [uncultured Rubrobacteraceae bacterium]|uniref:Dipeptidyl anminopeptidase n=1 Tax=uncultured Rubrobacteraceae bacterium TaxID=349277 RepID=A0A6J4S7W6_9ACTN|nr:MAG: Dipeptidyl anminopeptidase [uncultured Rubrobacteraceae bacterium]